MGITHNLRTFLPILIYIICSQYSSAQVWTWDTILQEKGTIQSVVDNQGNVITYVQNGCEITRYLNSLVPFWKKKLPSNLLISNIVCANDQSIYVLGSFTDTIRLGSKQFISKGSVDILLARLNAWGEFIWIKPIGSKGEDRPGEVAVSNFAIVITGGIDDSISIDGASFKKRHGLDLFVASLSSNGVLDKMTIAVNDTANAGMDPYYFSFGKEITISKDGDVFVAATFYANLKIGSLILDSLLPSTDPRDVIIRFDSKLNAKEHSRYSKYRANYYYLTVNSQNEIFYVSKQAVNQAGQQCSLNKISSNGSESKMFGFSTDYNSSSDIGHFSIDKNDNLTVAGTFARWCSDNSCPRRCDFFVRQYSLSGSLLWQTADTMVKGQCYALRGISEGEFLITGFKDSNQFMALIYSHQSTDVSAQINNADLTSVYPNPNQGRFSILTAEDCLLTICNLTGTSIQNQQLQPGDNYIELLNKSPGVYILILRGQSGVRTQKTVLE